MPTYKNTGTAVAFVGGMRIEAGETIQNVEWFSTLPTGVEITSENPFYNPIIYSAKITSSGTYEIPNSLSGNYKITFACASGDYTVKLSSSNGTAKVLVAGETYSVICLARTVDSLIWTVGTAVGSVTVESI